MVMEYGLRQNKKMKVEEKVMEFELPEELIQHIQSFLEGKQAARTSLLSKSWYQAWSARPILDFGDVEPSFSNKHKDRKIRKSIRRCMKRYKKSNIKLEKLALRFKGKKIIGRLDHKYANLVDKLIKYASKLGVTELVLGRSYYHNHNGHWQSSIIHEEDSKCARVPDKVFDVASLIKLSLRNCLIDKVDFKFPKLCVLCLWGVSVPGDFFIDFSSKFPCMEELDLQCCTGYNEDIHVSSTSLKLIRLELGEDEKVEEAEFDVPNIHKFVFKSYYIPALSFRNVPREWESEVSLWCRGEIVESSWFVKLGEFLKELSSSKISLALYFDKKQFIKVKGLPVSSTPVVDNLKVSIDFPGLETHDLLCGLFRCCRPTFFKIDNPPYTSLHYKDCRNAQILQEIFIMNQNITNYAKCLDKMQSLLIYI